MEEKEILEKVQKWTFFFFKWVSALQYDKRGEITGRKKIFSNLLGIQVCKEQHQNWHFIFISWLPRNLSLNWHYTGTAGLTSRRGKKKISNVRMSHTDTIWILHHKKHGQTALNSQRLQSPHWSISHSQWRNHLLPAPAWGRGGGGGYLTMPVCINHSHFSGWRNKISFILKRAY